MGSLCVLRVAGQAMAQRPMFSWASWPGLEALLKGHVTGFYIGFPDPKAWEIVIFTCGLEPTMPQPAMPQCWPHLLAHAAGFVICFLHPPSAFVLCPPSVRS